MSTEVDDFLAHHGVKGMRWGHRKREDSPANGSAKISPQRSKAISADVAAKRKSAADKLIKKAGVYDVKISELNAIKTRNPFTKHSVKTQTKDLTELRDRALKDADAKSKGKLTVNQKKLIIGGAVLGAIIVGSVVASNIESGQFRRLGEKGKLLLNGGTSAFDAFKRDEKLKDKNMSVDDIQKLVTSKVNPDFGDIGTKMNCRRTTFAYELRRRGYDVQATRTTNASGQNTMGLANAINPQLRKQVPTGLSSYLATISKEAMQNDMEDGPTGKLINGFTNNAKNPIDRTSVDDIFGGKDGKGMSNSIFERLNKEPERSRGELSVNWKPGGGHSMAYEIINGKTHIIDNQSNKIFSTVAEFIEFQGGKDQIKDSGFTRLDDAHLNANYLLKWVKNAS